MTINGVMRRLPTVVILWVSYYIGWVFYKEFWFKSDVGLPCRIDMKKVNRKLEKTQVQIGSDPSPLV